MPLSFTENSWKRERAHFGLGEMDMDEDSDDSSSPPETLDQFREKWQKELSTTKSNQKPSATPSTPTSKDVNTPWFIC